MQSIARILIGGRGEWEEAARKCGWDAPRSGLTRAVTRLPNFGEDVPRSDALAQPAPTRRPVNAGLHGSGLVVLRILISERHCVDVRNRPVNGVALGKNALVRYVARIRQKVMTAYGCDYASFSAAGSSTTHARYRAAMSAASRRRSSAGTGSTISLGSGPAKRTLCSCKVDRTTAVLQCVGRKAPSARTVVDVKPFAVSVEVVVVATRCGTTLQDAAPR